MEILLTSLLAFISTNIDDLFLLTLFFGNRTFRERDIVIGQLLGISSLIAISLVCSLVGLLIDQAYVGLLGLVPVYLGIRGIWTMLNSKRGVDEDDNKGKTGGRNSILTVAGVTVANGGDNIGIYIPLFVTLTWPSKLTMITCFLVMTLVWCLVAKYFTKHPYVANAVDKYGHIVTPFVLVVLGIYIVYESGTFELLMK
jgi:cadmium resistance transport/sequestration family protein